MSRLSQSFAALLILAAFHVSALPVQAGQTLWATTSSAPYDSPGLGTLVKISPAGVITTVLSGLNNPTGITFDASGNVYFVDYNTSISAASIFKLDSTGTVTNFADESLFSTHGLQGLTIDSLGNIYATGDSTVFKVTPGGVVSTFAESLSATFGITVDPAGNVYVASFSSGNDSSFVSKFDSSGTLLSKIMISGSNDVAFAGGSLYVTATGTNTIDKVDASGVVTTFATDASTAVNLAVDASGTIYAANYALMIHSYDAAGNPTLYQPAPPSFGFLAFQPAPAFSTPEPSTIVASAFGIIGGLMALASRRRAVV